MKKKILSVIKFIFFILIGIALLWLVFRKIDIHVLLEEIYHANYWWIGLSIIFAIFSHIARAVRWNILINQLGYQTRTSTTFYSVMVGYLANLAFPRLGEVTRCGVLSKTEKIPFDSLFGSVVAERVFDFIILMLIIIGTIVFQLNLVGGFVNRLIFEPIFSKAQSNYLTMLYVVIFIVIIVLFCLFLIRYLKSRFKKNHFYEKIEDFIKGFLDGLKTIKNLKNKSGFFLWTFVLWLMYFLMTYVVFFSMEATSGLTVIDGITVLALGSLGMVAPVPGGIGSYHFIVKAILFELYGISSAAAASYATIMHSSQTIFVIFVGAISYFILFTISKKSKNATT
ncbi:MAG: flippase-like domain-containing protein [Bacteroidales bacterium]|nr:flippase-like domain-containing protein [Bacteroidales bacterium]